MDYDVIIVGARVAGSSLAILLGRQGRRVLLVDRDRFPSDTLSTHLLQPSAVEMLGRLGALTDVEASGLRRLARLRTYAGETVLEGALRAPGAYALCARRYHLDHTLIRHALRHPSVALADGTTVGDLLWEDGRVYGVQVRGRNGRRRALSARVVVGADGKSSKVAEWVGARRYEETPAQRPLYYAYYRNVLPLPEPMLEVFYQGGRIGFVMPMEPGIDCLALELQPGEFSRFRADPAGRFDEAIRSLPGMARRLTGARRDGPVRGTRGVENYLRVPYGPGWALTGDAAYCKDPSTGTGIEDAFRQAFLLEEPLGAALDGADWDATMAAYHERRDAAVLPAFRNTLAYTRMGALPDESLAWFQAVAANAGLVRQLATAFPIAAQATGVFPAGLLGAIERSAGRFVATYDTAEALHAA
jgi:2-polyprenyl-6-methoxyphenol hydroxylase-like FAD-dependent oxidoreductase